MPQPTRGQTSHTIVHAAHDLRRSMTPAEKKLWDALRGRQLNGLKFRRQHPLDRFILDFYCVERRLVVEVDSGVHATPDQSARDADRTVWLNAQGIRVLRVKNEEVENGLDEVLRRIVEDASTPRPLPHKARHLRPSPASKKHDAGEGEYDHS